MSKQIFDPIHGFISITPLMKNIIDIVRINKNLDRELLESNIRLAHEKII